MVKALKLPSDQPNLKQKVYFDSGTPGFGVRVTRNGVRTWVVVYRHEGRLRWYKIGSYPRMRLADARSMARGKLSEVEKGIDVAADKQEQRGAVTFAALAERYLAEHAAVKKKRNSAQGDKNILNHDLLPAWRARKAADIKPRDVIELIDGIARRGAKIQANRTLALVSRIYSFGRNKQIVENNPACEKPGVEQSRDRVLSAGEIRALWNALDKEKYEVRALFKLGLLTGQRLGEISGMRWTEIEGDWWIVPAERVKNKLAHRVPLGSVAKDILEELRKSVPAGFEFVFSGLPQKGAPFHSTKERIRTAAEIEDFTYHDLRRSAASHMASIGVDRLTIKKILNHVETAITAVYDRYAYDREKRAALLKWERHLNNIINAADRAKVVAIAGAL
jgi:integrase